MIKSRRNVTLLLLFIYPKSGLIVYLHRLILLLFLNFFRQFVTHVQNTDFFYSTFHPVNVLLNTDALFIHHLYRIHSRLSTGQHSLERSLSFSDIP